MLGLICLNLYSAQVRTHFDTYQASKSGHFLRPGLNTDYTCTSNNGIHIIEFYDSAQTVIQSGKILTFKIIMIIIKTYKSKHEVM